MTRLTPEVGWRLDAGGALDARVLPLLRGIAQGASLAAAVRAAELSYRSAWGLLGQAAELLGAPLVMLARGRGARLAPLGERLLAADDAGRRALARHGALLEVTLAPQARAVTEPLRIAASHDLALAAVRERWQQAVPLDIAFKGSLESLASYARGEVTLAGFHVPDPATGDDLAPFRRWLDARRDRCVRFIEREQGLMVAAGNPHRVRSLADLARRRLRFVNRQRGSGTRLLVDQLLARAGVDPGVVRGYTTEEFTHAAVAASVAAGQADVGIGVRAAAARLGLAFVPLTREVYWFAVRTTQLRRSAVARFLEALRGDDVKRTVRPLAGYSARDCGRIVTLEEALVPEARKTRALAAHARRGR